jgi:hypothetical protein
MVTVQCFARVKYLAITKLTVSPGIDMAIRHLHQPQNNVEKYYILQFACKI